jgi:hypothetical protein
MFGTAIGFHLAYMQLIDSNGSDMVPNLVIEASRCSLLLFTPENDSIPIRILFLLRCGACTSTCIRLYIVDLAIVLILLERYLVDSISSTCTCYLIGYVAP